MSSKQQFSTPKQFLKTISIMYFGILLGPLAFAIFIYSTVNNTTIEFPDTKNMYQYLVPTLAIFGYFFGKKIYNQKIIELKNKETLLEKLSLFQTGFILKLALLEGPALLGLVAFSKNENLFFMLISGTLLFVIALLKPTKLNIESVLNLSSEQQSQFNEPNKNLN